MKAEFKVGDQEVELDTSDMEKRITDNVKEQLSKYQEELKQYRESPKDHNGKGVVEAFAPDAKKTVIEELRKGGAADLQKIKEQWTIAVPYWATHELAGHLRDYVFVTDVVKGKAGETVNIPYVKDIEFAHLATPKTDAFTATTGLINVLTTTLHESGAYYDAYYGDIEKIDSNMLDELNRVFAHAAIRSEDLDLVHLLDGATTAMMTSASGESRTLFGESTTGAVSQNGVLLGNTLSAFAASWVARGIGKLLQRGKEARPGECILIMGARPYKDLLTELAASTPVAFAKGEVINRGMVEDYLGVKIVVVGHPGKQTTPTGSTNSMEAVYMIRPKRALALAPKRDILIETDKLIASRQLRITASHTYGVTRLDPTEVVKYLTKWET